MEEPRRSTLHDLVEGTLLFGALGPALGSVPGVAVYWTGEFGEPGWSLEAIPLLVLFGVPYAYTLAWAPAVACGAMVSLFRARLRGWKHVVLIGVVGALLSMGWGLLQSLDDFGRITPLLFGIPGFIAGSVCAYLFRTKRGK